MRVLAPTRPAVRPRLLRLGGTVATVRPKRESAHPLIYSSCGWRGGARNRRGVRVRPHRVSLLIHSCVRSRQRKLQCTGEPTGQQN